MAKTLQCTLEELGGRMSAEEYGLWLAWHGREPLDAGWWQAGMQASVLANVNRTNGADPFTAADFIPDPWTLKPPEPETDPADFVKRNYG